jgi:multidrug transporter EmrE-like cation transporter
MHTFKGFIFGLIAQILTFIQLQGQMKYDFLKNNLWFTAFLGVPISLLFMFSVRNLVTAYNNEMWPSRLIGFGIGVIVFAIMSYYMFKEPITPKTLVCLGLASIILLIQLIWK